MGRSRPSDDGRTAAPSARCDGTTGPRLVAPVARSKSNTAWSTRSSTLLICLTHFLVSCRRTRAGPADGGREREVVHGVRKTLLQKGNRVGAVRLIGENRDEDLS